MTNRHKVKLGYGRRVHFATCDVRTRQWQTYCGLIRPIVEIVNTKGVTCKMCIQRKEKEDEYGS